MIQEKRPLAPFAGAHSGCPARELAIMATIYQGNVPSNQEFWVASKGLECQVVNTQGHVSTSSCLRELPALCSQSAGFMASAETATSLTVHAQNLEITGYVWPQ